ncbi:uncharacterized protein DUF1232 [Pseudomonas sp. SJZ079]|uniref:YkvA family protein n=1 Tax=Pseudomonas sp. SJZ079 TaxID=2572887 RepID=UPI001199B1CF|nr:YkvA family protein [Pseudomonas sp. SJZ079]TWC31401.1 uncharacterized protein DUF1232 [Pseudomonas sp. SJZ079]
MKNLLNQLRVWARELKRQIMVLWFSYRHPETPRLPKWIAICVVAYALSPIDLIPDFIPILGYLDDVIILPLGILLAMRMMPIEILEEARLRASEWEKSQTPRPVNRIVAVLIVMVWLAVLAGVWAALAFRP